MQTQRQYRQGDVMLVETDKVPTGAIIGQPDQDIVLVRGQATGNTHALAGGNGAVAYSEGDGMLVVLSKTTTLLHQEHSKIDIPAGTYEVRRKREYTPEAVRFVED